MVSFIVGLIVGLVVAEGLPYVFSARLTDIVKGGVQVVVDKVKGLFNK